MTTRAIIGEPDSKKIPLTKAEWLQLQSVADQCREEGLSVSPAQLSVEEAPEVSQEVDELLAGASSKETISQLRPVAGALVQELKARKAARKAKR